MSPRLSSASYLSEYLNGDMHLQRGHIGGGGYLTATGLPPADQAQCLSFAPRNLTTIEFSRRQMIPRVGGIAPHTVDILRGGMACMA